MSLILAATLIIGGVTGAVAVAIAMPVLFGVMAYDAYETRAVHSRQFTDARMRVAVERGVARAFVVLGGTFWSIATFAGLYTYQQTGVGSALLAAFYPLVACLATLIIGRYYERTISVLLMVASIAVVAWGVIYQFEMGVWILVTIALIGPMVTASALFWMARREQEAFEFALRREPELATAYAEK